MNRKIILKEKIQNVITMLNGPPVVVKLNKGTQGVGVVLCDSMNDAYAQIDLMWKSKSDFIIQEFIKESKGVDIRALVVGNKVIASMKRESKTGDFRSNTHQGGEVSAYELPDSVKNTAVEAAKIIGLNVAGVDLLISNNGYKIIEINSSPGFEGLEKATGVNVAGEIMKFSKELAKKKINKDKDVISFKNAMG